jgi:hypothetical protein
VSKILFATAIMILAGSAGAREWRELRIDASSQARFEQSVARFQRALPKMRRQLFELALADIRLTSMGSAAGESSSRPEDYFGQIDGLRYREVLDLADATKPTTMWQWMTIYGQPVQPRWGNTNLWPQQGFTGTQTTFSCGCPFPN